MDPFDTCRDEPLAPRPANYQPLSPVLLLQRSANTWPDRIAVVHGSRRTRYAEFHARCCRLASALQARGIGPGDTVAVIAPNIPAMLEAHFGVLMVGAVLNALNTRLDASVLAYCLTHGKARLLLADTEYAALTRDALGRMDTPPPVIDIADKPGAESIGECDYEALLAGGDPDFSPRQPQGDWQSVSLLYTSGTTGKPKGVLYHSRGAYLGALSNALTSELGSRSVYLWTLPMFHCNGWTFPWAVTAVGATHVCLRKVEAEAIFELIEREGVTHMNGAPVILNMLIEAADGRARERAEPVNFGVGGAPPPSSVIERMAALGFRVTHMYGTTETYGPSTVCAWQDSWRELDATERARRLARQGVRMLAHDALMVADPETGEPVARDGETLGEVLLRGNGVMKGYLDDPQATAKAFAGEHYHTGDLAVWHPDGYIEVRDRSKDIIISGGENIASLEVEEVLFRHPEVVDAAVVAVPDARWGEVPCAFVTLRNGSQADAAALAAFCREQMARFKCPQHFIFGEIAKTVTGKVQKFRLRRQAREALERRAAA